MRTRKTNEKEIAPTVCDPTLSRRATCGAQVRRGPAELAALKQLLALIRRTFRSSAQPEGGRREPGTGRIAALATVLGLSLDEVWASINGPTLCGKGDVPVGESSERLAS